MSSRIAPRSLATGRRRPRRLPARRLRSSPAGGAAAHRLVVCLALVLTPVLAGGCAPAATVHVAPGAGPRLAGARRVWVERAELTSGGAAPPATRDLTSELVDRLARSRRLEAAPNRAAADLLVVFRQSDSLDCYRCATPGLWQWWGVVLDPAGRELASLHGEVARDARPPLVLFLRELERRVGG